MSELAAAFTRETQLVSRLIAMLATERKILAEGNPDGLEALTREKNALIGEIGAATHLRETSVMPRLLGRDAVSNWLATHPEERAAATAWEKLIAVTREAQEAHTQNGLLIDALIRKTNDALAILTQHQREHSLYGRDGQTAGGFGRRIIDSA